MAQLSSDELLVGDRTSIFSPKLTASFAAADVSHTLRTVSRYR
jgi:hypothetical protein